MTEKSYTYKCDIYPIYLRVHFVENVQKYGVTGAAHSAYGNTGSNFDIFFSHAQPTTSDIFHEATHAKNGIFKYIEYTCDVDNDEVECYLMGWIGDKIQTAIKKYNK